MIILAKDLDTENRFLCMLRGWAGFDPRSGAYLWRSAGYSKLGRPRKYVLCSGKLGIAKPFRAVSDAEAREKANAILEKEGVR